MRPLTAPEPPVTADHAPERPSAEEREALHAAAPCDPDQTEGWEWGVLDRAVERILAAHLADAEARLAAVEVLLTQWRHDLLTNPPTSMRDLGWVQGVEEALGQIEAALHPTPSEQPARGGDDT